MKSITITDKDYHQWVVSLSQRYRHSQIKAAVKVNREMLQFYWSLGRDIVTMKAESRWGSRFLKNLSADLKHQVPDASCFSETNLLYMKNFYFMFSEAKSSQKRAIASNESEFTPQVGEQTSALPIITPQVGEQFDVDIFSVPWGHIKLLIDKFKNNSYIFILCAKATVNSQLTARLSVV